MPTVMEGTRPIVMNMEGTPPLTGRALPNLINAVRMLKSTSLSRRQPTCLSLRSKNRACFDFDFDFNIPTAFIRLGRARPVGAGCPPPYFSSGTTITQKIKFSLRRR